MHLSRYRDFPISNSVILTAFSTYPKARQIQLNHIIHVYCNFDKMSIINGLFSMFVWLKHDLRRHSFSGQIREQSKSNFELPIVFKISARSPKY